ncbi:MAG: response regulator, partial [Gammaproteobacteria bacterium]|nr:response regulator [Gammaproteobacteria bacterium]
MRVLIVEDNAELARQVKSTLEHEMYVVDIASDGEEGLFMGETEPYDAIILDLGLPKLDGLSILQKWRSAGSEVPVLILTSRDTWREKVTGLRAGADDYLRKPFEFDVLLGWLESLIRRGSGHASPLLACCF